MQEKKLKFFFVVQGEGRGHMTQAIALKNILTNAGHDVIHVMIGTNPIRQIPNFFYKKIGTPTSTFASPYLIQDKHKKSLRVLKSLLVSISHLPTYWSSLRVMHGQIQKLKPDIIINFFDPLVGPYAMVYRPKTPIISIAHQYLFQHKDVPLPKQPFIKKLSMRWFTTLTALGSQKKIALSFQPFPPNTKQRIEVLPPLLRPEVFQQTIVHEPFVLAYVLNDGYAKDIYAWHKKHPEILIHCFSNNTNTSNKIQSDATFTIHPIHDKPFLENMSRCKAFITTAGFESICEAFYFGKPILMVPIENHFEQFCNAVNAEQLGIGVRASHFELSTILSHPGPDPSIVEKYRIWVASAPERFLVACTEIDKKQVG